MKIERAISWYDKSTNESIGELNVDHIPLTYLRKIFSPTHKDPLLYNPFTIRQFQAKRLAGWIELEFDLDKYIYQLDCFQA